MKTTFFAAVIALSTLAVPAFAHEATLNGVADPATQTRMLIAGNTHPAVDTAAQFHTAPERSAIA